MLRAPNHTYTQCYYFEPLLWPSCIKDWKRKGFNCQLDKLEVEGNFSLSTDASMQVHLQAWNVIFCFVHICCLLMQCVISVYFYKGYIRKYIICRMEGSKLAQIFYLLLSTPIGFLIMNIKLCLNQRTLFSFSYCPCQRFLLMWIA